MSLHDEACPSKGAKNLEIVPIYVPLCVRFLKAESWFFLVLCLVKLKLPCGFSLRQ